MDKLAVRRHLLINLEEAIDLQRFRAILELLFLRVDIIGHRSHLFQRTLNCEVVLHKNENKVLTPQQSNVNRVEGKERECLWSRSGGR